MEGHHRRRSQHGKHKSMRGNPEGDSIVHRSHQRMAARGATDPDTSSDSGVSSLKRRKQRSHMDYGDGYPRHKMQRHYDDTDLSSLDMTDTPDSLSQISAIAPVSDISLAQSTFTRMLPTRHEPDETWENAVSNARGEPDGAEKSFNKKRSRVSLKGNLATVPEDESIHSKNSSAASIKKENLPQAANQAAPVERKKSIKGQLRKAASVLKKARSRSKLPDNTVGQPKKKLDATLADETMTKKPPMKELSKKERKHVRKTMKSNFDQIQRSKKIWEELRRQKVSKERKEQLCDELHEMVRGKMKEFCYAHDTARVIQALVQFGTPDQREQVFEELKDEIPTMAKSKYAKFLVKKMLMYGTKHHRGCIYKSFHGHVRKLIRHREASEVLEYAYNEYANANQRLAILEDFYGPSFSLFKTHDIKCLGQIMLSQPDKREMILRNMREALLPLIDKNVLAHSMVHKVFVEFFTYADVKMRSEMVEALRDSTAHILHTRDGARVAMHCVWHGTAKDRKFILKSLKGNIVKICQEEYGHMVLLAVFDSVDDTKLVRQIVLEEMLKSIDTVAKDQYGRKVLLYLLSPRDPHHFHPDIVRVLQDGDQSLTSKKDKDVRYRELQDVIAAPLLEYVVEHVSELVVNNNMLLLLLAIITHARGDPSSAMEAVSKIAAEPLVAGNNMHILENTAGHMTIKRLIVNDKERMKTGDMVLFAEVLLRTIPDGSLKSWAASNRGCFTLVFLLELEHQQVSKTVLSQLKSVKGSLRKMNFKGAQVLLEKIEAAKVT